MAPDCFYIYGYYGSKNAGDEAFRLAFQQVLPAGSELHFIRPSELANNQQLSARIQRETTQGLARLIVGGGAIIGEPYFWSHLPPQTPYHIVSADIGSQDNLASKYIPTLQHLQTSWIRSEADTEELCRLCPSNKQIHYLPDIVLSLGTSQQQQAAITALGQATRNKQLHQTMEQYCENIQPENQLRNKNMAIFLSDHYYDYKTIQSSCILEGVEREAADKTYLRQLRLSLNEISPYYNLYFFSLSFWHNSIDAFVGYQIAKASSQPELYNLATQYIPPDKVMDLMPYFDAAISMKFHGLIFPLTANIPVLNLGNSKKNLDLARQMGIISIHPERLHIDTFLESLKQVESVEYATSLAETRRLAHESIHTALSAPGLWNQ
jgi:polysaccharide pyruvyl transferase WcaK-like protein